MSDKRKITEWIVILLMGVLQMTTGCQKAEQPPNFVFILVDDLGWKDLGCYGSEFYETPHIDALASRGVRFTSAYAACPVCSPTRASILSGKFPARLHTTDYFGAPQPENSNKYWKNPRKLLPAAYVEHMPLEELTLAEALKKGGYNTFFAGKWHLGGQGFYPEDQGFDVNRGGWERGGPYGGNRYFSPYGNPKLSDGPEGEHLPDRLAKETCLFIEMNQERPFLAYLSFYSVHTPLLTRQDLEEKYRAKASGLTFQKEPWGQEGQRKVRQVQDHAVYAGMVEAMDLAVGKVMDKLSSLGLEKNTVVFLMSDNGGLSTSEGHPTSNLPLRAGKGWLYEGGIREPMIVFWPGKTAPDTICDEVVVSTDFYPTILEMAGLPAQPEQHLDGISLVSLLRDRKKLPSRAIYWHYPHYGNQGGSPGSAIRQGQYKLIEFYENSQLELYDLTKDLGETQNLAESLKEKALDMQHQLHSWLMSIDAGKPVSNPAYNKMQQ